MILRAWQLWRAATLDENTTRALLGLVAGFVVGATILLIASLFHDKPVYVWIAAVPMIAFGLLTPAIAESLARFSDGIVRQAEAKHGKAAK